MRSYWEIVDYLGIEYYSSPADVVDELVAEAQRLEHKYADGERIEYCLTGDDFLYDEEDVLEHSPVGITVFIDNPKTVKQVISSSLQKLKKMI